MLTDYKMSVQPDYVLVERAHNAEKLADRHTSMLQELSSVCEDAACHKVLIVGQDAHGISSAFDILALAGEIAESRLRIAVVDSVDHSDDDIKVLERAVWNRGGYMRFFTSEAEARYWLRMS
jgi:hypothetical protein